MKTMKLLLLSLFFAATSCNDQYPDLGDGIYAEFTTNKGTIICVLEYEKTPITVANFISLAEGTNTQVSEDYTGKKFYDGLKFHRVIADFMVQGGCPLGTGSGDPGYKFKDEFDPSLIHDKPGILSMANSGPKTNGSQFFITHKATPWLNNIHTIFGHVIKGQEVVDSIAQDDVIKTVKIIRKGRGAKKFDAAKIFNGHFDLEKKAQEEKEAKLVSVKKETVAMFDKYKAKAETLASGIQVSYITKTDNSKPEIGSKVSVNYAGFLSDGTLFDSNIKSYEEKYNMLNPRKLQHDNAGYKPASMDYSPQARLIQGFRDGLLSMSTGDKILVFIPSHLGYGERGTGPIPPNADLVFELEIVSDPITE
jgi:cyclophilin family peptidyl-prolyl cis-trans isomerase